MRTLVSLLFLLSFTACGFKGALYLPKVIHAPKNQTASSTQAKATPSIKETASS